MKNVTSSRVGYGLVLSLWSALLVPSGAELSGLKEDPFRGLHAALETRKFTFTLDGLAVGKLMMPNDKDKLTSFKLQPTITFVVEEVRADGSTVTRRMDKLSLTSKDAPFRKQGKSTFTGSVTAGGTFEGSVELDKGVVRLGGRLVTPGATTKGEPRFGIRVEFPPAYPYDKTTDKEAKKKFEKKTKDDRLTIVRTDGSKAKFPSSEKIAPNPAVMNGAGIAACQWEIAAYFGRALTFKASPGSKLLLNSSEEHKLAEGFTLTWYPDPAGKTGAAADPAGKAGAAALEIDVR